MGPEEILQAIRKVIEQHEAPGPVQWYVDELVIDCDADEFWAVVGKALEGR
jgi:hypothetical protein